MFAFFSKINEERTTEIRFIYRPFGPIGILHEKSDGPITGCHVALHQDLLFLFGGGNATVH
jgi:hypothetical protein